jgi:hypothetical protein
MNEHVRSKFKQIAEVRHHLDDDPKGNHFRLSADLSRYVTLPGTDISLVRTAPFAGARNIWKYLPQSVGLVARAHFLTGATALAYRKLVNFNGMEGITTSEAWLYDVSHVDGDCGKPIVLEVNKGGLFGGIHVSSFSNGKFGALVLNRQVLEDLNNKLPGDSLTLQCFPLTDTPLQPLYHSSELHHFDSASMMVLGSLGPCESRLGRSKVRKTRLAPGFEELMTKKFVSPRLHMKGGVVDGIWMSPTVHKAKGFRVKGFVDTSEVARACADYFDDAPVKSLAPLPMTQAVNGVVGDPLIKAMNLTTSPGIYGHFVREKRDIIDRDSVDVDFKSSVWKMVRRLEQGPFFLHQKWARKDEPTDAAKDAVFKFRYFMVSDPEILVISRMFLAPLVGFMYENKEFFECFGAFNPASPEFGRRVDQMKQFPHLIMADMSHMDSSHRAELADVIAVSFAGWAKSCGYNDMSCKVVANLIRSVVFSLIELMGDVALFSEGMGSGIYLTFLYNCLVLSVLYRIAWFRISVESFRKHNCLSTGGDDSMNSTDHPGYTGVHIQKVFRDYGYVSTPPTDKTGSMQDFFEWRELVFLKRSPSVVQWGGVDVVVGALAKDSIYKSLCFEIPSVSISPEQRLVQVCDAAQREMALHGRESLEEFQARVAPYEVPFKVLSWDEIMKKYYLGDLYEGLMEDGEVWNVSDLHNCPRNGLVPRLKLSGEGIDFDHEATTVGRVACEAKSIQGTFATFLGGGAVSSHNRLETIGDEPFVGIQKQISTANTNSLNNQSLTEEYIGSTVSNVVDNFVNVMDLSTPVVPNGSAGFVSANFARPTEDMSIMNVLKRPIRLSDLTWTTAFDDTPVSVFAGIIDSWRLNPIIRRYLSGYTTFRVKPKLIVQVGGGPMTYGSLVLAAKPFPGRDSFSTSTGVSPIYTGDVSQLLQMRHLTLGASEAATYSLELPWISTGEWNVATSATVDPENFADWTIYGCALNQLRNYSATDTITSIRVTVWVQMTEVELSIPSILTLQSKESLPGATQKAMASSALPVAGALTRAAFPAATPLLSGAVSALQKAGYASAPVLEESVPTLNDFGGKMSMMNGRSTVPRLVGDVKQGVSISSSVLGCGSDDDVMIASVIRKWGFIGTATWAPGPTGSITNGSWNPYPTFNVYGDTINGLTYAYSTPLGYVSRFFRYYTGTIRMRFEIVASPFHRGSLVIGFVPLDAVAPVDATDLSANFLSKTVDITQTRSVEFDVPYYGKIAWSAVTYHPGTVHIMPSTALSSQSTSLVDINVYISAGEDFQLARPNFSTSMSRLSFTLEEPEALEGAGVPSAMKLQSADEEPTLFGEQQREPSGGGDNQAVQITGSFCDKYFGEQFVSFKQILSRHCAEECTAQVGALATNVIVCQYRISPRRNFTNTDPTAVTWFMNPISYLEALFVAVRGGYRHKIQFLSPPDFQISPCVVSLSTTNSSFDDAGTFEAIDMEGADRWELPGVYCGSIIQSTDFQNCLEFEVPEVNRYLFRHPGRGLVGDPNECIRVMTRVGTSTTAEPTYTIHYRSVADDWSAHEFLATPAVILRTV